MKMSARKARTEFVVPGPSGGRALFWAPEKTSSSRFRREKRQALELRDERTGQVLALFHLMGFQGKQRGKFEWSGMVTAEEEVCAVMVMMAMYIQAREKSKKAGDSDHFIMFADSNANGGGWSGSDGGGGWGSSDGGGGSCGGGGGGDGGGGGGGGGGC